jgi:hypothetical protein
MLGKELEILKKPNEDQTRYRTLLSRFISLSTKQDDISILIGFFRNEKSHDAKSFQTIKLIAKAYNAFAETKKPVPTSIHQNLGKKKRLNSRYFLKLI